MHIYNTKKEEITIYRYWHFFNGVPTYRYYPYIQREFVFNSVFIVKLHLYTDVYYQDAYTRNLDDRQLAEELWGIRIWKSPINMALSESIENRFKKEDFVSASELDFPKGKRINDMFKAKEQGNDSTFPRGSKGVVRVYYIDLDRIGTNGAIGRCYWVRGYIHIIMSNYKNMNTFAHELGHAFYYTNLNLNGKDPISGESHNNLTKDNLMNATATKEKMKLELKQKEAIYKSYIVNAPLEQQVQYMNFPNKSIDIVADQNGNLKCIDSTFQIN